MKKFIISFILLLVCFPNVVFADMAAPSFQEYEAIVAQDSVDVYSDRSNFRKVNTLEKGTKVKVRYEEYIEGKTYAGIYYKFPNEEYEDYYYIKISDLMLADAKFDLKNAYKISDENSNTSIHGYVYGDDVYLYNGPSKIYSKVSGEAIPKGTKLDYEYYDGYDEGSGVLWAYTTYNGKSGWVFIHQSEDSYYKGLSGVAGIASQNSKILSVKDIMTLYSIPSEAASKQSIEIPKYKEIEYKYYVSTYNSSYVYISYEGKEGWIKTFTFDSNEIDAIERNYGSNLLVIKEKGLDVYNNAFDKTPISNIFIPVYTELKYNYHYKNWFLISYNKNNYWINVNCNLSYDYNEVESNYDILLEIYSPFKGLSMKKVNIYDLTLKNVIGKLSSDNLIIESNYMIGDGINTWVYIKQGNLNGFVLISDLATEINEKYLTVSGTYLYNDISQNDKRILKADIKLNGKYSYVDKEKSTQWIYVDQDDIKGYIKESELASQIDEKYITVNKAILYKDTLMNYMQTLDNNIKLEGHFLYKRDNEELIYVLGDDIKGYIKLSDLARKYNHKYQAKNIGVPMYKLPESSYSQQITTLPSDTMLYSSYLYEKTDKEKWLLINCNGIAGWVLEKDLVYISDSDITDIGTIEQPLPILEDKKPIVKSNLSTAQMLIICSVGAICLSLTALVTIKLLKRKKKNKDDSNPNENVEINNNPINEITKNNLDSHD